MKADDQQIQVSLNTNIERHSGIFGSNGWLSRGFFAFCYNIRLYIWDCTNLNDLSPLNRYKNLETVFKKVRVAGLSGTAKFHLYFLEAILMNNCTLSVISIKPA